MRNSLEFFIERQYAYDGYGVHVTDKYHNDRRLARPLLMEPVDPAVFHEPTFMLSQEEAARLMDALWNVGVRPSNGAGSQATHEAQNNHIRDLQKIVFALLPARTTDNED